MSSYQQIGFMNDGVGFGDLDHLVEEQESDDEHRDDEIKQALLEALNNETFDDESEHSYASISLRDGDDERRSVNSVIQRHNSFGFPRDDNEHSVLINNNNILPFPTSKEDFKESVSAIHKTHCPQLGNGDMSSNGNLDSNWSSTPMNKLEDLERLNSYRERQMVRAEETICNLTKDKRALNHQIGLMRTEMIQMKGAGEDLEKALDLKNEEIDFLKSKIQEAIVDYEALKRQEVDLKDENNRLESKIGRLEQEVALLSTIGSSAQQAEVDTIVRQIRDRHAQEIISFKTDVSNLQAELRAYKRQIHQAVQTSSSSTQTSTPISTTTVEVEAQTDELGSFVQRAEVESIVRQIQDSHAREIRSFQSELANLEGELRACKQRQAHEPVQKSTCSTSVQTTPSLKASAEVQTENALLQTKTVNVFQQAEVDNIVRQVSDKHAQEITLFKTEMASLEAELRSYKRQVKEPSRTSTCSTQSQSSTTEVQTEETLKTYEVLGTLMEQWANEVSDATKRAELAESQFQFTETSLKKLRKKFKSLQTMTSVCRKEWKKQEESLHKRNDETKAHYLNLLLNLQAKLDY